MLSPFLDPNALGSFFDFLAKGQFFDSLLPFLLKFLPTVLWTILVPMVLFFTAQGREFLTGLFDDAEGVSALRGSVKVLMYHFLGMAIFTGRVAPFYTTEGNLFTAVGDGDNTTVITMSHPYVIVGVCILPMLFYGISMAILQIRRSNKWWKWVTLAGSLILSGWLTMRVLNQPVDPSNLVQQFWKIQGFVLVNLIGVALLVLLIGMIEQRTAAGRAGQRVFWIYFIIGFGMCLQIPLTAATFKVLDIQHNMATSVSQLWLYNGCYVTILAFAVGMATWLGLVRCPRHFSPTFVLLVICLVFLMLGDLMIAGITTLLSAKMYWLGGAAIALFVFLLWLNLRKITKMHYINLVKSNLTAKDRLSLDDYFEQWWKNNIEPDLAANPGGFEVYLMPTQGGGSRAGYWVSAIANRLDLKDGGKFRKRLFAVTSASGGSSGFAATLSMWRFLEENSSKLTPEERKSIQLNFARQMYERNYLSNQFIQIFINEPVKRIAGLFGRKAYGRNYYHQLDEARATADAIQGGYELVHQQPQSRWKQLFGFIRGRLNAMWMHGDFSERTFGNGIKLQNYPLLPYLSFWYKKENRTTVTDTSLPLFFPITTQAQAGCAGYASPVIMDKARFIETIDIVDRAEKTTEADNDSINIVTAASLSQLFPILNAYTYIQDTGNFIDGGMAENQGLPVMTQLYDFLAQKIKDKGAPVTVRVINVVNSAVVPADPANAETENMRQLAVMTRAASFGGIAGRTIYWQAQLRAKVPAANWTDYILQHRDANKLESVPLGRWMARRSMSRMEKKAAEFIPLA
jgi:hypothetical protein